MSPKPDVMPCASPEPASWHDIFTGKALKDGYFDFADKGMALFVREIIVDGESLRY